MTLKEMNAEYEEAAQSVRDQLRECRNQLKEEKDPERRWHIKRKIAELTPILTELNDIAWILDHYYERGGERDDRYCFNGTKRPRTGKQKKSTGSDFAADSPGRIDKKSAGDFCSLPFSEEINHRHRRRTRRTQVYYFESPDPGGEESWTDYEIPEDASWLELDTGSVKRTPLRGRKKKGETE